jgi:hypothetical protein
VILDRYGDARPKTQSKEHLLARADGSEVRSKIVVQVTRAPVGAALEHHVSSFHHLAYLFALRATNPSETMRVSREITAPMRKGHETK